MYEIKFNLNKQYYFERDSYSEDEPTCIYPDEHYQAYGNLIWLKDERFHRVTGPARIWFSGSSINGVKEKWYINGQLHRIGGPAVIGNNGIFKEWWVNGLRHREDGPAVIFSDGTQIWFRKGVQYTKKRFYETSGKF